MGESAPYHYDIFRLLLQSVSPGTPLLAGVLAGDHRIKTRH